MLTAKTGDLGTMHEALDTGADDFLTKPFSFVVLLAHLRALMRRGGRERPTILSTAGDLRLDPAAAPLTGGERGPIEADPPPVLAAPVSDGSRAGEVLSKTEMIEHVWDFAFEGDL